MELFILKDKLLATLDNGVEILAIGERVEGIMYCDTSDTIISNIKEDPTKREIRLMLKNIEKHTADTEAEILFTYSKKVKVVKAKNNQNKKDKKYS